MTRRGLRAALVLLCVDGTAAAEAPRPRSTAAALGDKEKEAFLLEAEVVHRHGVTGGIMGSLRATLRRGGLTHDAEIEAIDQQSSEMSLEAGAELRFDESYKNNVAAYRLDRLLGLGMVPATVLRRHGGKPAAFTWWLDGPLMTEQERYRERKQPPDVADWNRQIYVTRVFDQLICNFDRNAGNLLIDRDWRVWMIGHTRAFKTSGELREPARRAPSCERDLLAALRRLDRAVLEAEMKDLLTSGQIDGLLARRDRLVAYYDQLIAARGERAVLYDLPSRAGAR